MTKKEFEKLKPGDKVRIVRERVFGMNDMGEMDKWLGKVMTVKEHTLGGDIHMVEDQHENYGGWFWDEDMIECKVPDGEPLKETAKDRVEKELAELEEKIEKLSHALAPLADKISAEDEAYSLLNLQLEVMRTYANILLRRLAIWKD